MPTLESSERSAVPLLLDETNRIRAFDARIRSAGDLPVLIALWRETRADFHDDLTKDWLCRRIFRRMIERDLPAAWTWARSFPEYQERETTDAFIEEWALKDAPAVLAAIKEAPENDWRLHAADCYIFGAWAKAHPVEFLKESLPESLNTRPDLWEGFQMEAVLSLMEKDLPQALGTAPAHLAKNPWRIPEALKKMADCMMAERGVSGALAWAKSLEDYPEELRHRLVAEFLPALARTNPEQAARELSGVVSEWTLPAADAAGYFWGQKDPAAAFQWALTLGKQDFHSDNTMSRALAAIGRAIGPDVKALMKVAALLPAEPNSDPDSSQNYYKLDPLVWGAAKDPGKLTADLAAAAAGPNQSTLVRISMKYWSQSFPLEALRAIPGLPVNFQPIAYWTASRHSGGNSRYWTPEKIKEFVRATNAEPRMADTSLFNAVMELLKPMVKTKPREAVELLTSIQGLKSESVPDRSSGMWTPLFASWAEADPQAAAEAVNALPGADAAAAAGGVVKSWVALDPTAASAWAESLPAGKVRNAAAARLAEDLASFALDPPLAFIWAMRVPDSPEKIRLLERACFYWSTKDRQAAVQAVENSGLPEKTRKTLLDGLKEVPE